MKVKILKEATIFQKGIGYPITHNGEKYYLGNSWDIIEALEEELNLSPSYVDKINSRTKFKDDINSIVSFPNEYNTTLYCGDLKTKDVLVKNGQPFGNGSKYSPYLPSSVKTKYGENGARDITLVLIDSLLYSFPLVVSVMREDNKQDATWEEIPFNIEFVVSVYGFNIYDMDKQEYVTKPISKYIWTVDAEKTKQDILSKIKNKK